MHSESGQANRARAGLAPGVAGCLHGRLPWLTAGGASFDDDTWELYNIEQDFSQADDLAHTEPKKLRDLQDRFMAEAAKYDEIGRAHV